MRVPARLFCALLLVGSLGAAEPVDWRFGFEDTWSQLGGQLNQANSDLLLGKLALLTAPQAAAGDININGTAGGWNGAQPSEGAAFDFSAGDAIVRRLQAHGFSMLWNLRINAPWASAGNIDCYALASLPLTDCAPDADHEDDLYDYIHALVERYDGDGVDDMGAETPEDPSDDLVVPIRFYLMTGEIEFAGSNSPDPDTYGDAATSHFWSDSVENLLRTHRIVHQALHDADPSGATSLVSSGGVTWDLWGDFPDWPAFDGPTVEARLAGDNNHAASYVESFARLETMLASFGDDSDGVECDYVGWHPHMPWRTIDQEMAWVRSLVGDKPIYVDDMWTSLFLMDRADAPGYTQFGDGGAAFQGEFPNASISSYTVLKSRIPINFLGARDWYDGRTARHLVKSYVSMFGEGAERVSFSGTADYNLDRLLGITGWVNLLNSVGESFSEKPAYWTYKLLVERLHDFSCVSELAVSSDPRTRVYRFETPRGPVWAAWSETGGAPAGLDYDLATGETVTIPFGVPSVRWVDVIDEPGITSPTTSVVATTDGDLTLQLGYRPRLFELEDPIFADGFECGDLALWPASP